MWIFSVRNQVEISVVWNIMITPLWKREKTIFSIVIDWLIKTHSTIYSFGMVTVTRTPWKFHSFNEGMRKLNGFHWINILSDQGGKSRAVYIKSVYCINVETFKIGKVYSIIIIVFRNLSLEFKARWHYLR